MARLVRHVAAWVAALGSTLLHSSASATVSAAPDPRLRRRPSHYRVDLDLPAGERWKDVFADTFKRLGTQPFQSYFAAVLSGLEAAYPEDFVFYQAHLEEWRQAYAAILPDALSEIDALADALYAHAQSDAERQLFTHDHVFLVQLQMQLSNIGQPHGGECTSVVVRRPDGTVAHFRNWDFGPLPDVLGTLSVEVDFHFGKSGRQGFRCLLALTHIDKWTTCLKEGAFSMSLNARGFGEGHERGRAPATELALLQAGSLPRVAVLREVMLAKSYEAALAASATARALTSMYVILAGPAPAGGDLRDSRGAVVTISGNGSSTDVLPLPAPGEGWFLVQTNVDHWLPMSDASPSSHRREHVRALLSKLGSEATMEELYAVLQDAKVFPPGNAGADDGRIFRPSTIASALMLPGGAPSTNSSWVADLWRPAVLTNWAKVLV